MKNKLARSITRKSSKQSYYTAKFMVDNCLEEDCYRAYSYFRWVDDVVDTTCQTRDQRVSFIQRQKILVDQLFDKQRPDDLTAEEEIIADLIQNNCEDNSKLRSYIVNFLAIIEFDAHRKGRLITQNELTWYSKRLGIAVTDAIQYFICNGHPYPEDEAQYLAATAAHMVHMLRDMREDVAEGYINIPREYLEQYNIEPGDFESPAMRNWVKSQIELAKRYSSAGKRYLDGLDVLRCKIVGYWYCLRFEGVIKTIEKEGYILRTHYPKQYMLFSYLRFAWMGISISVRHAFRNVDRCPWPVKPDLEFKPGNQ
jgi:phytoene/squalene synthetase